MDGRGTGGWRHAAADGLSGAGDGTLRWLDRVPPVPAVDQQVQATTRCTGCRIHVTEDTFISRAARWASRLSYDDIPQAVREAALAQRASTLGAAVWTREHPVATEITETTTAQFESGPATLLTGGSLAPMGAAYGNAALALALDFDDTILGGHTGHSAVFGALAYAEAHDVPRERALVAQVAANEVGARVASAAAVGPFRGQQTTYVHALCGVLARAVVADDDASTIEDALGIALGSPPWPLAAPFFGGDAKLWLASEPLRRGLAAVDAARAGQRGFPGAVEAEDGFLESFATLPLESFLEGLGERWHTRAVTVKAVPGCAYVTAPVEAALQIAEQLEADPADIESVRVYGSLFATEVDERARPYLDGPESPLSALTFTVPYGVAAALADGEFTPRQFSPERLEDQAVWALADRVELDHDESFTMAALESEVPIGAMLRRVGLPVVPYSAKIIGLRATLANLPTLARFVRKRPLPTDLSDADKRMGARVEVTVDGTRYVSTVEHPRGFAGQPLADITALAREKYRDALVALGDDRAGERATEWTEPDRDAPLPAPVPGEGVPAGDVDD